MMGYYIMAGAIFLISSYVSNRLKSKFKKYSKIQLRNGLTGAEIAQKMLEDNGIRDVEVISTRGQLTDHYNPKNKTVNLSEVVYSQRNAAAAAVAAHEVGHAVQHATAYSWLQMRSKIVPAVGISSKLSNIVIMAGLFMTATNALGGIGSTIFLIGILLFAVTTAFA
nr:zinc metallopeptidase [Bacteroidota bacterium]